MRTHNKIQKGPIVAAGELEEPVGLEDNGSTIHFFLSQTSSCLHLFFWSETQTLHISLLFTFRTRALTMRVI